ncbi:MAG: hypothetical protein M1826_005293 [Phylliscum demangeonii]|nr:MAG: hypothetical protein M1826_005293 [Phylliscum demangeonii]
MSYPPYKVNLLEKATTGTPFLRVPSYKRKRSHSSNSGHGDALETAVAADDGEDIESGKALPGPDELFEPASSTGVDVPALTKLAAESAEPQVEIPVGISRLHVVELPNLAMKPIYWSPVNDISSVTRATWFYKESLLPVEAEVANQLEAGYLRLEVWTETWDDELKSAAAVGAEGEAKVVHKLWPTDLPKESTSGSRPGTAPRSPPGNERTSLGERPARLGRLRLPASDLSHVAAEAHIHLPPEKGRRFAKSGVIYRNQAEAFILRPNLLPSAYYGRRPLAKIRKGVAVGIPVVRGFDWSEWEKMHPSKKTTLSMRAEEGAAASQSAAAGLRRGRGCPACLASEQQPKVTDLILVIHGIGQKLSQRFESFHFTHLINSLRRAIHVELADPAVQSTLRPGHGGIMTLPINWRATLSFDDDDDDNAFHGTGKKGRARPEFSLKDITPGGLPAVRNIISDVMFDIPYYLSHHKTTMIEAVVRDANRVYRLWCQNNPGFADTGRVHLIAHSLGSVMALDILSRQPTTLPTPTGPEPSLRFFDFDTKNLILSCLLPRKGRRTAGGDGEDAGLGGVTGDVDTYGCLAVDNIYNVLNDYDPIAYRLNSTVDRHYAASLQTAFLPSASTSLLSSLSQALLRPFTSTRTSTGPTGADDDHDHDHASDAHPRPSMPSTIELETHNFSREEVAEKRMYLLNDNGQIDYFLRPRSGPLDIQYLNMLSAHSSYWAAPDFVRFLVAEVARGGERPLRAMRAVKRTMKMTGGAR